MQVLVKICTAAEVEELVCTAAGVEELVCTVAEVEGLVCIGAVGGVQAWEQALALRSRNLVHGIGHDHPVV